MKHIWRNHRGGRNPVNSARPEHSDNLFEIVNRIHDSLKSPRTSKETKTRRRTRKISSSSLSSTTAATRRTTKKLKKRRGLIIET